MVYRIAASIAILMMISTVFIFIGKNKTGKNLADNSVQPQTLEIKKSQPVPGPEFKDRVLEKQVAKAVKKTDKSVAGKMRTEPGKSASGIEELTIAEKQKNDSVAEYKDQQVEKNFAVENIVAPKNAMLAVRSFTDSKKFEAKADSQAQGKLDSSISDLSEVVVVGYGVKKAEVEVEVEVEAEAEKKDALTGYTPATPVNGKSEFDKYIRDNLHRPDSATTGQRVVVVVSFLVRTDGSMDSIRIVRSPGKLFSDEAIRVIKSGPSWNPAKDSGKTIKDEVRVRVIFR
jgi:outer membrane biosynthesis protein TonB